MIAPVAELAPTVRAAYAPSIPHCSPRMNTSPSTMIAEPVIRIPAWRIVSPMNWNTRRLRTFQTIWPQNRDASPNAISAA